MRRLLLSDIHSNMEAFEAAMERADRAGYDDVLCCGDIVGYGPDPNEAVARVKGLNALTIRGNHDRVSAGLDEPTDFNPHAKAAALWTRDVLTPESVAYLRALPVGPLRVDSQTQLVHGAITHEDDYIMCEAHAAESFAISEVPLTFFGHSHFPCVFSSDSADHITLEEAVSDGDGVYVFGLKRDIRYLVNPGSVGQPRDGDNRSSFAIWDTDAGRVEFYRVRYPYETTQEKMRKAGLPTYLIDRLTHGR